MLDQHIFYLQIVCIYSLFFFIKPATLPRLDRGSGNFYIMNVPNKRVARVNLACDENLKAQWVIFMCP